MCGHCVEGGRREAAYQERQAHQDDFLLRAGPPGSFSPVEPSPPGWFSGEVPKFVAANRLIRVAALEGLLRDALKLMEDNQAEDESSSHLEYCRWCSTNGKWNSGKWVEPFEHTPDCILLKIRAAVAQKTEETASEAEIRHERLLNGEPPI